MTERGSSLFDEGVRLVRSAAERGVTLRLMGALAVRARCPRTWPIAEALGRHTADVDVVGLSRQWDALVTAGEALGYRFDERYAMLHGNDRLLFHHPSGFRVDVFLDGVHLCHTIDLRERLGLHPLTLSVSDLLLQKLQIVELTTKDVIDIAVLLLEHGLSGEPAIDPDYISHLLAGDWGFHRTATLNLGRVREGELDSLGGISEDGRRTVRERIGLLLERVEAAPKSLAWRLRARIGPRVRWYREVGELAR
ncbi:MAG TPA: hypothetical protein VNO17_11830 [Actinomycetota bacterium]|nr:hypothetical protein [Actinomycetota bacterium]